ncbi:MAG: RNA methyltransferase, partial [Oscillospiraceae bacterium]|nr:RNA methyltransferase [Oscillospiraceae bacterium]
DSLKSSAVISDLLVTEAGIERLGERFAELQSAAKNTLLITDELARQIGETDTPQGVFAICEGRLTTDSLPENAEKGILMLCSLQDPGNVGTILRSAEAFGLSAVIMTADCPDAASPKVLRSSMGAALRIAIHRVPDAAEAIEGLREKGIAVYAAALGEKSVSVDEVSLKNSVVMIGNEGSGLPDNLADAADKRVILPISENSESLNAAMAATVFAWELSRAVRNDR